MDLYKLEMIVGGDQTNWKNGFFNSLISLSASICLLKFYLQVIDDNCPNDHNSRGGWIMKA